MRSRRLAGALLTGTFAVAAAGCGGGSNDHLDAAFAAKVNTVCQHAITDKASHPFPLPNFDPRHPSASQLPVIGSYFSKYGDAQYLITSLNRVGEPPTHADEWNQLRSYIDQSSRNALAQQQVAKAKDVAGFEHTLDVSDALQPKIDSLGKKLGFSASSACGRYFG